MSSSFNEYKEVFSDTFSIRHKVTTCDEKLTFHIHDELELLLILSEDIKCTVNDKTYFLKPNTLLIFNNMDLHYVSMAKPGIYDRYVVFFKPEYIDFLSSNETNLLECFLFRPFSDPHILPLTEQERITLIELLDRISSIDSLSSNSFYGRDLYLKIYLAEFLLTVNAMYRNYHKVNEIIFPPNQLTIYKVINYIHQNYYLELSLDSLASMFFLNKFHLCSLFKGVTGTTLTQYLISCRMTKAKELLLQNYTVDETCRHVGYNSLPYFSREFKRKYGMSPKQYQMLCCKGQKRK